MRKAFILLMLSFAVFAFRIHSTPEFNLTDYTNQVVSGADPNTIYNLKLADKFKTTYEREYCFVVIDEIIISANDACSEQSGSFAGILQKLTNTIQ